MPTDSLVIVGDLCDFWMGAREPERRLAAYPSLRALAEFRRQGGSLAIMAGQPRPLALPVLRARPRRRDPRGTRRPVGARAAGPAGPRPSPRRPPALEGRDGEPRLLPRLRRLPGPIARPLDRVLTWKNERGLLDDEERHLRVYRAYAATCRDAADIVVIGHVHRPVDESGVRPAPDRPRRMAVPLELPEDRRGRRSHCVVPDREPGNSPRGPAMRLPPGDPRRLGVCGWIGSKTPNSRFKIRDSIILNILTIITDFFESFNLAL